MVFGGGPQLVEVSRGGLPGGQRIEDVEPFEDVAVGDHRRLGRLVAMAGRGRVADRLE
jgi:hypothetical protein